MKCVDCLLIAGMMLWWGAGVAGAQARLPAAPLKPAAPGVMDAATTHTAPKPDLVLPLWPGDAPGLAAGEPAEVYVNGFYRNVSQPQLLVYLPKNGPAKKTALIIAPGGSYIELATALHVDNVVQMLNGQGIVVIGLKYRVRYGSNNAAAEALADAKRAVRIVRSRAGEWGIDPARIGVQGYSAGGNLCLVLAGRFDAGDPQAADPIERVSCRPDFMALMCTWPNRKTINDYPLMKDSPPAFIANAQDDRTAPVTFATAIDGKLKGLGVTEKLFVVPTGGHAAFHYGAVSGPGVKWPEELLPWLKKIGMMD